MQSHESDHIVVGPVGVQVLIESLVRMISEDCRESESIAIIGIQKGGVPLANEIHAHLVRVPGMEERVSFGTIDISFHRDDIGSRSSLDVSPTEIGFDINNKHIILVDDVIESGRTVRAAINSVMQLGRPEAIRLAVLVDRRHRHLPLQPDFVGRVLTANSQQTVELVIAPDNPDKHAIVLRPKSSEVSS